jgi:hypothetical protein
MKIVYRKSNKGKKILFTDLRAVPDLIPIEVQKCSF